MKEYIKAIYHKKIKICLVFFCVCLLFNCKNPKDNTTSISNIEINKKQVSFESESELNNLSITLVNHSKTAILGDWSSDGSQFTFIPALPFTRGETYSIKNGDKVVYTFSFEDDASDSATELKAIYPTSDSLPENLLKMYLVFSKPMQEIGNSLDYISVVDNTTNKEVSVFLELQTELWNQDHTVLTLWLDPGRVKTDLIPNKKLGLPLLNSHNYNISIDSTWKDAHGKPLIKPNSKTFTVRTRDSIKPDPKKWMMTLPNKDTKEALIINFKESMDYILARECLNIMDSENNKINGHFSLLKEERELHFYPSVEWKKGNYKIIIEPRLEDLAGNNLSHLFDTDLDAIKTENVSTNIKPIRFAIN